MRIASKTVLWTVVFFLLLNLASSVAVYRYSMMQLETRRFEKYRYQTNYYAERVNAILLEEEEELAKLSLRLARRPLVDAGLAELLRAEEEKMPHLRLSVCLAANGRCLVSDGRWISGQHDFRRREWYSRAAATADTVYSTVYASPDGTKLYVSLSKGVFADGALQGVICADLRLEELLASVRDMRIGRSGYAAIVSGDGVVIAHPFLPIGENLRTLDGGRLARLIADGGNDREILWRVDFAAAAHWYGVQRIGGSGWILIACIDDGEISRGVFFESLILAVGTFFLLGVGGLVFASFLWQCRKKYGAWV